MVGVRRECNRPKTRVVFTVRRVVAENVPGDPVYSRAQMINASYPDEFDAFLVDNNKNVIHDQWKSNVWSHSAETLTSKSYQGGCGWMGCFGGYYPVFPARAHIAALAKAPGNQDIFAISSAGKLVSNWRNKDWDSNHWHDWTDHSGAYFPAGAPVAAVSRNPGHIDIFAIATDGSMMATSWEAATGWSADTPRNGTTGGGLAAVSTGIDPYASLAVFASGTGYWLVEVSWTLFGGWRVTYDAGEPSVWYQPGGNYVALERTPNRTDLLFVDAYGHGRTIWFDNGWKTQQLTPDSMPAVPGGEVRCAAGEGDLYVRVLEWASQPKCLDV